jgi:hypothetical protein
MAETNETRETTQNYYAYKKIGSRHSLAVTIEENIIFCRCRLRQFLKLQQILPTVLLYTTSFSIRLSPPAVNRAFVAFSTDCLIGSRSSLA